MKISFAVAAAALLLLVVLAPAASSGSPTRVARAGACGSGVWPDTAVGKPAALASSGSYTAYVWVSRGAWHLRVKAAQSQPVTGQLSANAQLRGVDATASTRSSLDANGSRLTFTVSGSRVLEGVDLQAACATRLRFAFGASSSGAASQPLVFLGARGQAPASTFALSRPATTGVSGRILIGPTCPIVGAPGCPPAKAVQGTVRIEQAPSTRGGSGGGVVARVPTDARGNFSARLAPGRYVLVVEQSPDTYPRPRPALVDVQSGVVSEVTLVLDTGIR